MVKAYDIPLACLSYQKYRATHADIAVAKGQPLPQWREDYDRTAMALLDSFEPDICVLAGYMLIVGEEMCQRYRMINLHPAAPDGPTGTWQEVIWKLLEDEAENTGIMMHLITPELDRGPVVTYCTFPIRGREFDKKWEVLEGITSELTKESEGEQNSLFQLIRRHGVMREVPLIISTLKILAEGKLILADGDVRNSLGQSIAGYDLTDEVNYVVRGAFR
jgi:hypothetical protein